jgi:SEC-C motif-containing protein
MAEVSRNDPCPCGSGRKYKRCCLEKDSPTANGPLPSADERASEAMLRVFRWSERPEWRHYHLDALDRHVGWLAKDLEVDGARLPDLIPDQAIGQVTFCALEDLSATRFEPDGRNLIDDYLARRGWTETAAAREYLLAVRDSVMSLYEVQDTDPGRSMTVKDLLRRGEPLTVNERLGSGQLVRWDILACRLVTTSEGLVMTGGTLLFSRQSMAEDPEKHFRRLVRRARKRGLIETLDEGSALAESLGKCAFLLSRAWLASWLNAVCKPPPELRNFDGHKLVFTKSRFSFDPGDRAAIIERLDGVTSLTRDDDEQTRWIWQGGPMTPTQADTGPAFDSGKGEDFEVRTLGTLVLGKNSLLLESNSVERGELGRKLITEALAELVTAGLVSTEDARKALAESRSKPQPKEHRKTDEIPADVEANLLTQFKDRHYREWVDHPLPALDGQTPRQASRTRAGRAKLISLLKELENNELRRARDDGIAPYDTAWMWEELKLSRAPSSNPNRRQDRRARRPAPLQERT